MRRTIIFPALLLSCTIIIAGFRTDLVAPANNPVGLLAPPEGGTKPTPNQILFKSEINPPSGGQLGSSGRQTNVGVNHIRIGLLIQDSSSIAARNGAELAIEKANRNGGYKGREFELIVKSMEGPWGTGSKQAVDLIFIDSVVAIVGSHDGRNAHLVEQATTKTNITFLSAWSGDPTLSQAFTPWFFNSVPNDNQQAELLINELKMKKHKKILIIADNDYDANSAFKSFTRISTSKGFAIPEIIITSKSENQFSLITGTISRKMPDCLLLFTGQQIAGKILSELKMLKINLPVYGPLSLLGEASSIYNYPEVTENILLLSSGDWYKIGNASFAEDYREKYGSYPGAVAAYGYDAMMIILQAVKASGADKNKVHKALMETNYNGVTGFMKFDEMGNRKYTVERPDL